MLAGLPGDLRDVEPPDPIPNSVVKCVIADGSVGSPHARVGHRQASNAKRAPTSVGALFHARFPRQPRQKHPQGTRDPREWPDEQAAPLRSKNKGSPTPVGSTADSRRQERSVGHGELGLVPEHCLQMAQQLSEQLSGTPM